MNNLNLKTIESIIAGEVWEETHFVTEEWIHKFIELTGDKAPVHVNKEHAEAMGFKDPIVHGLLVVSMFSRILGMLLPGPNTVLHQVKTQMKAPVFLGDQLNYSVVVNRIIPAVKTVQLDLKVTNQTGALVNLGEATCLFRK